MYDTSGVPCSRSASESLELDLSTPSRTACTFVLSSVLPRQAQFVSSCSELMTCVASGRCGGEYRCVECSRLQSVFVERRLFYGRNYAYCSFTVLLFVKQTSCTSTRDTDKSLARTGFKSTRVGFSVDFYEHRY
jgi:hypothetical protein